ncbi:MAG: carboxypeptidase-like regulatory domain-containing protein [Planctomycetota bacterium]|jgi:hypothetical protein
MARSRKRGSRKRLFWLLFLLLFALLFRFNPYLAGVLPGGGRWRDDPTPDARQPGVLEILVVRHDDRRPVPGVTLRVAGLDGQQREAVSDEYGRARFEGLAATPHRIDADSDARSGAGVDAGRASAWSDPGRAITMELAPRRQRTGQVRDEQGNPQPGTVHLLDADARILATDRTDADGRFTLPYDERAVAVCAWPDRGPPGAALSGDVLVGEAREAHGRLPAPGPDAVDVIARMPDSTEDRLVPLRLRWRVDPAGAYRGLLPLGADAWVIHDGAPLPLGEAPPPDAKTTLHGRVVDGAEAPLPGVTVRARPLRHGMPVAPFPADRNTVTRPDGTFAFEEMNPGSYALTLTAPGKARMVVQEVSTRAPPTTIVMHAGFRIRGRVLNGEGKPLRGVDVFALGTPDPDARYPESHGRTTDDGRFVLDRIGGEYARVRVQMRGYQPITMMKVARNGNVTVKLRRR